MIRQKQRALLHAADRRLRRNLLLIAAIPLAIAMILILQGEALGAERHKLLIQFFLITAGGGVVLAIVGNVREQAIRRQERAAAIQALDRELDGAYRALKKTKRKLRALALHASEPDSAAAEPQKIPRAVFEKGMDELVEAQIELETICAHIGERNDILEADRLARMKAPLRYASRYYQDVHEDFEDRRVKLVGDHYDIVAAPNVQDYLGHCGGAAAGQGPEFEAAMSTLKGGDDLEERSRALTKLLRASPPKPWKLAVGVKGSKVRYAKAAAACFDLLSDELASARAKLLS